MVVFAYPGNELLANKIKNALNAEAGICTIHYFPDGESLVRIHMDVAEKEVVVVASLDDPNAKLLPLYYMIKKIKTDRASRVTLIAPYLAYLRQDSMFRSGEAVSSIYFAELISSFADQLMTVDPHLHRHRALEEIYSIPCTVIHAADSISAWIACHVRMPVLIGPDAESKQWIAEVAEKVKAPFVILTKQRMGDRIVKIEMPDLEKFRSLTPVLIDDIISSGRTMLEIISQLKAEGMPPAICLGIHALFAEDAYAQIMRTGIHSVVTCNTIVHSSNQIDVSGLIVQELKDFTSQRMAVAHDNSHHGQ